MRSLALGVVDRESALLLIAVLFLTLFLLLASFWLTIRRWQKERQQALSPYTGHPLRRATHLHLLARAKVNAYLKKLHQYDNPPVEFKKAAFCRETGRLFPNSISWWGWVRLPKDFLQKRYPGDWVSWGSLNEVQQLMIRDKHLSLEGYQTECSSPHASPQLIEKEYTLTKPGPLYVDLTTCSLLGWKVVPGSELEVLVVQKVPKKILPKPKDE